MTHTIKIEGNEIVIRIPVPADTNTCPLSSSQKNRVIASTRGAEAVSVNGKTIQVGLNVYTKKE